MNLFRVAREAPAWQHVAATLAQTAVFWTVFLLVLPALVEQVELELGSFRALHEIVPHARPAGLALFALGGALGLWSGMVMAWRGRGTPLPAAAARELVVAGPYRVIRNPMALGGIAQGVAVGLWRGSPGVVLYALAGGMLWHEVVRPAEERFLAARFGAPFLAYRDRVPLWLPRLLARRAERALGGAVLGVVVARTAFAAVGSGLWLATPPLGDPPVAEVLAAWYASTPLLVLGALLGGLLWSRNRPTAVSAASPRTP